MEMERPERQDEQQLSLLQHPIDCVKEMTLASEFSNDDAIQDREEDLNHGSSNNHDDDNADEIDVEPTPEEAKLQDEPDSKNATDNVESESDTSPPAETATTLEDQDAVVYGTISHDMADMLVEQIEEAIQTSVIGQLPLLQNNQEAKERLKSKLRYKFVKNVDVLEAYCDHNVLTLRKHPIARRKRIVKVLELMKKAADAGTSIESLMEKSSESDFIEAALNATAVIPVGGGDDATVVEYFATSQEGTKHPTKDEIPTTQQISELDDELETLKQKIAKAKERRDRLLAQTASIFQADAISCLASEAVLVPFPTRFREAAEQCIERVSQGQLIGDLTAEAERTVERLDALKRARPQRQHDDIELSQKSAGSRQNEENNDMTDDFDPLSSQDDHLASRLTKKRLSLEEAYQRDKKQLGLQDKTNSDLAAARELLKPRVRSVNQSLIN